MGRLSSEQQSWAINIQSKVTYSVQTNSIHLVWIRGGKSGRQEVGNDVIGLEQPGARLSYDRPVAFRIIGETGRKRKGRHSNVPRTADSISGSSIIRGKWKENVCKARAIQRGLSLSLPSAVFRSLVLLWLIAFGLRINELLTAGQSGATHSPQWSR